MRDYKNLIRLCHHRWTIPILAELYRAGGSRFAAMANGLKISRASLTKTLQDLILNGLVQRNPGYGHPLRPEYILSAKGREIGPACREIMGVLIDQNHTGVVLNKWSLPVLSALGDGHDRFAGIKSILHDITSRALTLTLKSLQEIRLVDRTIIDEYPPTARYSLTTQGRTLEALGRKLD